MTYLEIAIFYRAISQAA